MKTADTKKVDLLSRAILTQKSYTPNQKILAGMLIAIGKHITEIAFPQEEEAQAEFESALKLVFEGKFEEIGKTVPKVLSQGTDLNHPLKDAQLFLQKVMQRSSKPITRTDMSEMFKLIGEGFGLLYSFDSSQQWELIIIRNFVK